MTAAANTGLIFATAPVWGFLLGLALGFERPTWRRVLAVALSLVGAGLIFWEGIPGVGARSLVGDLLFLLATLGVGSYAVLSMPILGHHFPLAVATYPILFGGPLVLALFAPFFAGLEWEGVGPGASAAVTFSAMFATALAFSA